MIKIPTLILLLAFCACKSQSDFNSTVEFTSDLEDFGNISKFAEELKDVEIIALGENTHGLGEVFKAKTDLVKFLNQELGFSLVLFESGYGDAAMAWERLDSLSVTDYTRSFSSNFYYHSEEIEHLMAYVKSGQNNSLVVQGFDCQPQQDFLIQRMTEIIQPVDTTFAKSVAMEMRSFNNLYRFENDKDSLGFYKQRDDFVGFLNRYENLLDKKNKVVHAAGITKNEINAIKKSIQIFKETYATINFGDMMGWPVLANIRDKSLFETVKWFKEKDPDTKIIIWAQNSHIENRSKPKDNVKWMGHSLKNTYGDKYYSIGTIVYSGTNLDYNGSFDFKHDDAGYLAYHLHQYQKDKFVLNLRNYNKKDFTGQELLGMESNGNTAAFIAKDRFDGLLFIMHSDIPTLIKKK